MLSSSSHPNRSSSKSPPLSKALRVGLYRHQHGKRGDGDAEANVSGVNSREPGAFATHALLNVSDRQTLQPEQIASELQM